MGRERRGRQSRDVMGRCSPDRPRARSPDTGRLRRPPSASRRWRPRRRARSPCSCCRFRRRRARSPRIRRYRNSRAFGSSPASSAPHRPNLTRRVQGVRARGRSASAVKASRSARGPVLESLVRIPVTGIGTGAADMNDATQLLEQNQDRLLDDLKAVLRIPSVSAQVEHRDDMKRCADHIAARLKAIGMTRAEVMSTQGHPVVYAEWLGAPGRPTALLYGHYDVQPADPLELWTSPPFEPTLRDGKLYARGAVDDKGQVWMHVSAIEAHMKASGKLPINLKLMIEGEEEVGSEHLEAFIRDHRPMLDADVILVSDTAMMGPDQPALTYGLRGILYTQIDVQGPSKDLHSGHFGGTVENPANALATIIAALKDAVGQILDPAANHHGRTL